VKFGISSRRDAEARKMKGNKKNTSLRLCGKTNPIDQDFSREVYCLFGVPVDNLTLAATKARLRQRSGRNGSTVLSTININWVAQSLRNPDFRAAILNSEMVTLDGRPLLWLARLFGYPMTEVVAGSTLIQELDEENKAELSSLSAQTKLIPEGGKKGKPLTIFFFGGEKDAGRLAMERVNNREGGLKGVGFLNPGFGSVEEMSSDRIIEAINRTEPDILLVALGATKGTQWIERNRHRLKAKVVSHLGATINFLAGKVDRAPKLARKLGLEWSWRIIQEPKLFPRYATDGLLMLRLLASRFPLWLRYHAWQMHFDRQKADPIVLQKENDREITLSFGRNLRLTKNSPARALFSRCARSRKNLTLDFQETRFASGAFMGLLLILFKYQQRNGRKLLFVNVHGRIAKIFKLFCIRNELPGKGNES
jgi:N-acetylglucosaminyldiphosphoundecaprenol N-acetyl-beta-D-mannosaminyltransferase